MRGAFSGEFYGIACAGKASMSPCGERCSPVEASSTPRSADMSNQGSTGNIIAALCNFVLPGLGQLVQGPC